MLRQSMKSQNELVAKQVVDAISQLVLPVDFKSPFSYSEKTDLFFFLGMTEICTDKRKSLNDIQEDFKVDEQSLQLKRVRMLENEEGGQDNYHSFKYNALENSVKIQHEPNQKQNYESSQEFNSIEEIEQAIDFTQMIRAKQQPQPLDRLGPRDNSIILSLNQMIQMHTVSASQLLKITKVLIIQEASQNMMTRYYGFLDSLSELIKTVVRIETKKDPTSPTLTMLAQDVCKFIESLPKYNQAIFELLKSLTELTMQGPQFDIYMECFKILIKTLNKFQDIDANTKQASIYIIQSFVKLNDPSVLEFLKTPEAQQGDWQSKWPSLEEEALLKVDKLVIDQEMVHKDACLNFVFYVGTKQIQISSHAKILGKLIDMLPQGQSKLETDVQQNLMKIKEKMDKEILQGISNLKFLMKTLAKAINNWDKLSLKLIVHNIIVQKVIFVDFTVSANMLHTSDPKNASILFVSFIDKYVQKQYQVSDMPQNLDTLFQRLIQLIFGTQTSEFSKISTQVIQGLQMNNVITLLTQDNYNFRQLILADTQKQNSIQLFLRFIKENQQALKDYNLQFEFIKMLDKVEHVKTLLKELISWNKPQAIFMYIILNSMKPDQFYEDEVASILNQNWKDNKNLKQGLQTYLKADPHVKNRIFSKLDNQTRQLAVTLLQ